MSLKNNKAAQLNRYMMFGTFFLGIIVLGCVFAFLYLSTSKESNPFVNESDKAAADTTLVIEVTGDSAVIEHLSD